MRRGGRARNRNRDGGLRDLPCGGLRHLSFRAAQGQGVGVRQLPARVHAQFVGEQPAGAMEPVERLRAAARPLERPHEGGGQRFAQRMGEGLGVQDGGGPGVLTQLCVACGQLFHRSQPELLPRMRGGPERWARMGVGQRGPPPQ